ncbi:ABC transporter substrate-binding protein [Phytoactinopolyspora alkaliphila]|uniref:ABC transporter substrate-binding protein n=1 Tax=Phytoactinopolyspora alkaliphila TaxID=1783498 RepID=A0A6N9YMJ0_9ACTN|nr:ABC transporter substrate-binding protein [Phytoactinopolyspora alkaliphila]NED96271.1 ABC transporter substrate-binding protein [Phytoactinopolyspora alkaliphila]
MRVGPKVAVAAALTVLLAACGSSGDGGGGNGSGNGNGTEAEPAVDATFTTSVTADPGNLHPHLTALSATREVAAYMYDRLVHFSADGDQLPWLAESWDVTPDTITYTIRDGITCSDGSELTASDVAANFEFILDPANESPVRGVLIPPEMDLSADDDARTVTITVPRPDPFLLHSTGDLFIACRAGLDDPDALAQAGIGTGMYELTEAAADDHYTFERRDEYAWGPDGIAASEAGTAKTITLRVIANESTAVNLFLSGELDAVSAVGPDRQRLEGEYHQLEARAVVGELFFNQAGGHVGEDPEVRAALAQALDFNELMSVVTGGHGEMSTMLAAIAPTACQYDAVSGHLPEPDPDAARAALDAAGWTEGSGGTRAKDGEELAVSLIYNSTRGDATAAAAELMAQRWNEVGVATSSRGLPPTEYNEVIFGTGDWDAALLPVNVRLPSQLVPFLSGAVPPEGVNLAHLENDDYVAAVGEAMDIPGQESCTKWQEAEEALFAAHDVLIFADETIPTFLDGVTAERGGDGLVAPTIRMSAE